LAPPYRGSLNSTHFYGTRVPVEEPSTASKADIRLGLMGYGASKPFAVMIAWA
jgi:hypothetical protein